MMLKHFIMTEQDEKIMEQKLDRILFYLESDKSTGHIGMAEQQQINTKGIDELKGKYKIVYRVGIALGSIGVTLLGIAVKLKSIF